MTYTYLDGCVSLSNELLDGLLAYRLTSVQLRTILWVLRNAAGCRREAARFSWYQIARELGLDRAGVFRAGTRLIAAKILWLRDGDLGIQYDPALWRTDMLTGIDDEDQRQLTSVTGDTAQRR